MRWPAAIAVGLAALVAAPMAWPHAVWLWTRLVPTAQDRCAIGNITPDQYRAIAAELGRSNPIDLGAIARGRDAREGLRDALAEVVGSGSDAERLARLHAALRRQGAFFAKAETFVRDEPRQRQTYYTYSINANLLGVPRPICSRAILAMKFTNVEQTDRVTEDLGRLTEAGLLVGNFVKRCNYEAPASPTCPLPPTSGRPMHAAPPGADSKS